MGRSETTAIVGAEREAVYRAFLDPDMLMQWQAPEGMTAVVHSFDGRVGGGYEMSLFYDAPEEGAVGKTAGNEDRYTSRFIRLEPPSLIVQAIRFDTVDPEMAGEMTMTVTLAEAEVGTEVTIAFEGMPAGISAEDNDAGTRSSLEKLARYVEAD